MTSFLDFAILGSFGLLIVAFFLVVLRLIKGPTIADRVLSLDMMTTIGIAFVLVYAVFSHRAAYLDIAIALGLVGFLATVAFARYILWRASNHEEISRRGK